MYVSMIELMKKAREGHYCVPAAAVENEHTVHACIKAAEEMNSPLILISLYKVTPYIEGFGRMVRDLAMNSKVPVAMCQDHGGSFNEAIWAIRAGFTDIMVDRSSLPFEENVKQVKQLVEIAHAVGVGVEAELGHVGIAGIDSTDVGLTDPEQAVQFVKETGVDALAVAIGTAHGTYKGTPKLHFDLLQELREKVSVPLVLHGGSGTGDDNLRRACDMGITKLNLSNDLKKAAIKSLNSNDDLMGMGAYRMYGLLAAGTTECLKHYIEVCGSANKA